MLSIARGAMRSEAIAAVNRLIAARLEGNLGLLAAVGADSGEHLALRTGIAILRAERGTAIRAAARLVLEALLRIERLLRGAEDELLVAIPTNEGFVLIHILYPPNHDLTFTDLAPKARLPDGDAKAKSKEAVIEMGNDGLGSTDYTTHRQKAPHFSKFAEKHFLLRGFFHFLWNTIQ